MSPFLPRQAVGVKFKNSVDMKPEVEDSPQAGSKPQDSSLARFTGQAAPGFGDLGPAVEVQQVLGK